MTTLLSAMPTAALAALMSRAPNAAAPAILSAMRPSEAAAILACGAVDSGAACAAAYALELPAADVILGELVGAFADRNHPKTFFAFPLQTPQISTINSVSSAQIHENPPKIPESARFRPKPGRNPQISVSIAGKIRSTVRAGTEGVVRSGGACRKAADDGDTTAERRRR